MTRSLLPAAVLIGLLAFGTDQIAGILAAREAAAELRAARAAQVQPVQQAARIEAQLDSLASGTTRLAAAGNPNAQQIVAALQQSGVSIRPGGARPR